MGHGEGLGGVVGFEEGAGGSDAEDRLVDAVLVHVGELGGDVPGLGAVR